MATENRPSSRTVESLGKVLYHHKPTMSNQVAGIIISVIMFVGGFALSWIPIREIKKFGGHLPVYDQRNMSWLAAALLFAICAGLVVGGILLFRWVWSMFTFRLYVCSDGFHFTRGGKTFVFGWNEIQRVEETVVHERLRVIKGAPKSLMPKMTSRYYRVVRCDGEEFAFNANMMPRVSILTGPLTTASNTHKFEWRTEETGS